MVVAIPAWAAPGRLGGGGSLDVSLTRIITALLLCLMVAVLAVLALKRSGGRFDLAAARALFTAQAVDRRIEVIESRRLSQHADLCLVRCDAREYLILCSAQQQQVLRESAVPRAGEEPA